MILFFFLLFISISFSQTIQHEQIESSLSNEAINFNIFVDDNGKEIYKVSLMYKNANQTEYLSKKMILTTSNNFNCIVTDHFSNKLDINYYFIVEFTDIAALKGCKTELQDLYNSASISFLDYKGLYAN